MTEMFFNRRRGLTQVTTIDDIMKDAMFDVLSDEKNGSKEVA